MFKSPSLISVKDVPFDQGRKVELIWGASSLDTNITSLPYYSIWRAYPQSIQQNYEECKCYLKLELTIILLQLFLCLRN